MRKGAPETLIGRRILLAGRQSPWTAEFIFSPTCQRIATLAIYDYPRGIFRDAHKALSGERDPRIGTLMKVLDSLGVQLSVAPSRSGVIYAEGQEIVSREDEGNGMPVGGQAWGGEVIFKENVLTGGSYDYRLVKWENQPRIGFRWTAGGDVTNCPRGKNTCITLDAALYPAIINDMLRCDPNAQQRTRGFLGSVLAGGNYPHPKPKAPVPVGYRHPENVKSPQDILLKLVDVVLDRGPGDCAYMIGLWRSEHAPNKSARIMGFRWNGTEANPRGYPISTGWPIWIVLAGLKYEAIINILPR